MNEVFKLMGSIFINTKDAEKSLDDTGKKAEELSRSMEKSMDSAERSVDSAMDGVGNSMNEASRDSESFGKKTGSAMDGVKKKLDGAKKKAGEFAQAFGKALETAGKKVTDFGKALAPLSAGAGGILTASVKGASDFTDGMAKMSTLFDTTTTSVSDLSNEFLNLSSQTGLSATELAEAGYQALSAGQDVSKVVSFVDTATQLAKSGFTSTVTSVDILTTAMNAYGKGAGTAQQIANKLVRTQNLGKTTVDELASSMGKIIPTASSMGVNINNLTSGYVSLTKQGIATAEATTYMNSMLNELGDSGTDLGGILIEKTGKSFQDLMKEGYSLADVLQITKDYADKNEIAYNELWGSAEAGKAGLAILNGGVEEFNETVTVMGKKTDDIGEALEKLETPSMKVKKSLNQVKNSGIQLGQSILTALTPALDKVSSTITKVTTWFDSLDEKQKTMIATALGVVTALSPVLIILGKVMTVVGKGVGAFGKFKGAISGAKLAIAGLSAPIGVVIAVIGALIAVFVTLWNTNTEFRNKVIQIWNEIRSKVSNYIKLITLRMGGLKTAFTNIINFIKPIWIAFCNALAPVFIGVFENISNFLTVIGEVILAVLDTFIGIFTGDWDKAFKGVERVFKAVWNGIKKTFLILTKAIKKSAQVVISWFNRDWNKTWESVKNFWTKQWEAIKKNLDRILGQIKVSAKNAWTAIKSTISTKLTEIKSKVSTIWTAIKTLMSNKLGDIKSKVKTVWSDIKTAIKNKIDGIKTDVSTKMEQVKSKVTAPLDSISEKFSSIWETCKTTVSSAIDAIKGYTNFSWSLPKLKLPHISIEGEFSLGPPPKVPSFGISWYKKAMEQPYLFDKPTVFGMNGRMVGAGEAGDEMMYGKENLIRDIQTAVRTENSQVVSTLNRVFDKLFDILGQYFPEFASMQVVLDTGTLVGATAGPMDKALGQIRTRKGRR